MRSFDDRSGHVGLAHEWDDHFGNARVVRNLLEQVQQEHANRLETVADPTLEQLLTIEKSDVEEGRRQRCAHKLGVENLTRCQREEEAFLNRVGLLIGFDTFRRLINIANGMVWWGSCDG